MKYFANLNINGNTIYIHDDELNKFQSVTFKELMELYDKGEVKFDENYFIIGKYYSIEYNRGQSDLQLPIFKKLFEENLITSNRNFDFMIPLNDKETMFKIIENSEIKTGRMTSQTFLNMNVDINKGFSILSNTETNISNTKEKIDSIKTLKFLKDDKGYFIDLTASEENNELTRYYVIRQYLDFIGRDLTKDKEFNYGETSKKIYLKNINEIFFLKNLFKDIFIYNTDKLSLEENEYLENTAKIIENKIEQTSYNENIENFLNINKEGSVISDSVENKNEAVINWYNKKNENILVLGKPEALEKYQKMGMKNSIYISLDDLSSKSNIDEIQTISNNYKLFDNYVESTDINNVITKIEIESAEKLKFDVQKNRPILLDEKNQKEFIKNGDVKTIIRNIEVSKIILFINNNFDIEKKSLDKYFKDNILNKDLDNLLKSVFNEFNINIENTKINQKIKKDLKIIKKTDLKLEDIIGKLTKNILFNKDKNEFDVNLKDINTSFKLENIDDYLYKVLEKIDSKNNNNYFHKKLNEGNDFTIINNELFYDEEIKFLENIENEQNKVEYYRTLKIKEMMENITEINNILILNAEKLKSPTSTLSNVFLYMMKNKHFNNKVFVSSNPVYNKIAEIEVIFKSINQNLFENLKELMDNYNTRKSKDYKESFLGVIAKRYILKRNSEELSQLLKNDSTIKNTSFLNPKEIGNLKKESEYFGVLRNKLESKIIDIVEISLSRLENNRDYDINNKVMINTNKEKYLEHYFENFNNFQILLGNKFNSYENRKIVNIAQENNIEGINSTNIENYSVEEISEKLKGIPEFKKTLERKNLLSNSLYESIMNNKFKKYSTFDIETNELIDGINIKNKHINNIKDILETENGLTQEEKNIFLKNLKYNFNIQEYLIQPYKNFTERSMGIEQEIEKKIKILKNSTYYHKDFMEYKLIYNPELSKTEALNTAKTFQKVLNRIKKELLGEDVSFKDILMKSFSLKKMRRQLSEIKVPNTLKEINHIYNDNKNSLVLTTSNDVISELEEKLKAEGKNVITIKSQNKNEVMKNLNNETSPYVVLAGYKMLSEHIENNFEGEIVLNDLPFNYASLEQSISSIKKQDLQFWYLHNEEEEFEKLFKFIISSRNKDISQLMSSKEDIFENVNIDEEFFKESFIKNVFNKILKNINEEEFLDLTGRVKEKYNYKKDMSTQFNKVANEIVFF